MKRLFLSMTAAVISIKAQAQSFTDVRPGDKFKCSVNLIASTGTLNGVFRTEGSIETVKSTDCTQNGCSPHVQDILYLSGRQLFDKRAGAQVAYFFQGLSSETAIRFPEGTAPTTLTITYYDKNLNIRQVEAVRRDGEDFSLPLIARMATPDITDIPNLQEFEVVCRGNRP